MGLPLIAAGTSLLGGLLGGSSSKKAASISAAASDRATEEQRRQFDLALGLQRPGIEAGDSARAQLLSLLGIGGNGDSAISQIKNTPGFQFQTEQGTRALNADRSAGGNSGGALTRDFARFNQGLASNFYQDYANRLAGLASGGQQAGQSAGNQAITSGRGIAGSIINSGNARASGVLGQGNAFGNALNDFAQYYGQRGGTPTTPSNNGVFINGQLYA